MQVDIYIREKSGKREIRIPLLPEEIPFKKGDVTVVSYDIMGLGPVEIPSGTELGDWTWKSAFPGEFRKNDPLIRGTWNHPKTYDTILNDWKANGTELNLLVTGYPINTDVYLKEYHASATGAFGDISYEIAFFEARSIVVTSTKVEQKTPATTTRPAAASSSYTIKSGDTLWGIAKKFYGDGTKWVTIYNANKEIIESTAKARRKADGINRDSENGHWIFPGVTLTIPGVAGSSSVTTTTSTTTTQTTTTNNGPTYLSPAAAAAAETKAKEYTADRNAKLASYVQKYGREKEARLLAEKEKPII